MKLYVVTVATKREGYYDALVESCRRNGLELVVLGYGQPWQGFAWRFLLVKDFIETIHDKDIVIFLDAYDMISTQPSDIVKQRFLSFHAPLVMSVENMKNRSRISTYMRNQVFGYCKKANVCGGAYMGYVYALKKLYAYLQQHFDPHDFEKLDDQRLLTFVCQDNKFVHQYIKYDYDSSIFYNLELETYPHHAFQPMENIHHVQNNQLYIKKTNSSPCFVHGITNINMDYLINLYQLPPRNTKRTMYGVQTLQYQSKIFRKQILGTVLSIILLVMVLVLVFYVGSRFHP